MNIIQDQVNLSYDDSIHTLISIKKLKKIEDDGYLTIWDKQRSILMDRIDEMVEYYETNLKFRGSIIACNILDDDRIYLIDGQHRYVTMKELYRRGNNFRIRLDIIIVNDEDQIVEEFIKINKAVPVPTHNLQIVEFTEDNSLDMLVDHIKLKYPDQLVVRNVVNRPRVGEDQLKDAILEAGILELIHNNPQKLIKSFNIFIKMIENYSIDIILENIHGSTNNSAAMTTKGMYERYIVNGKKKHLILGLWPRKSYNKWADLLYNICSDA